MILGNEWHRTIFIENIPRHSHLALTFKLKWGLIVGILLFLSFVMLYLVNRYMTFVNEEIYVLVFIILSIWVVYSCLERCCSLIIEKFFKKEQLNSSPVYRWCQCILLFISFLMVIVWFLYRFIYIGWILTNVIAFCLTLVIVAQMRVVNLTICMISLGFVWLFQCLFWISRIHWGLAWEDADHGNTLISRMYMNMVKNDSSDFQNKPNQFSCTMMIWIVG